MENTQDVRAPGATQRSQVRPALAAALLQQRDLIVQRWYEAWRKSAHPRPAVGEAALKDLLSVQLKVIGEQLLDLRAAEQTDQMWKVPERLEPEKRIGDDIPVEEVVLGYRLVVVVVRDWIRESHLAVSFDEYSYFFDAIFELAAESVRRYIKRQVQSVTQSRAEYLAGIMHQVRTPLAALDLQIQALSRSPQPPPGPVMAHLNRNLRRLSFLVNGVLRVERFRPEEMPLDPRPLFPARLVEEIMADYEHEAAEKNLRFEAHVNRSLQMVIDAELFADSIGNFVQNALKYTSEGYVIVEAEERPEEVIFRVRDSGPGVPPDKQRSLFKEVQPGSAGGAGIGLQIARHAAEAQGGAVGVEGEPGGGAAFWLRLPRTVRQRE